MWLFLSEGFYSVVQDRNDPEKVMVRGRFLEDIERIATKLQQKLKKTPTADYPYRFTIAKNRWAHYLRDAAMNIESCDHEMRPRPWWPVAVVICSDVPPLSGAL